MATESTSKARDSFSIHVDRDEFHVVKASMSGGEIRTLPAVPIGPDRDLFLEEPGKKEDPLIKDTDSVAMKNGLHFYTGPSRINPG